MASQVKLGLRDFQVFKDPRDLQGPKELKESQDQQGHRERLGHWGRWGRGGRRGRLESGDCPVNLERRVPLVYLVTSGSRV